jgi:hypothetical protein
MSHLELDYGELEMLHDALNDYMRSCMDAQLKRGGSIYIEQLVAARDLRRKIKNAIQNLPEEDVEP